MHTILMMMRTVFPLPWLVVALMALGVLQAEEARWVLGEALVDEKATLEGKAVRLVDPAIVRDGDTWHVFASASGGTVWFAVKDLGEATGGA